MRSLTGAGAALLLLGLAACGDVVAPAPATPTPTRPPSAPATVAARPAATSTPPAETDPAGAAAALRAQVTGTPRLLPAAVPDGMQAIVSASPDSYNVEYTDDSHVRTIMVAPDAPVGVNGPHQSYQRVPFRSVTADYFINDTTDPASRRRLYWQEPGSM